MITRSILRNFLQKQQGGCLDNILISNIIVWGGLCIVGMPFMFLLDQGVKKIHERARS